VPADLGSNANARRSRSPAVFLLADSDTVVPPKFQKMVFDAYAGPKRRIDLPQAGHNTPVYGAAEQQLQEQMDWLWEQAVIPAPATAP
jgi:cephalosporin-C deacetylase-like acetyl esterase